MPSTNLNLTLNGKSVMLHPDKAQLNAALDSFGFSESFFAVAINANFIPRSLYAETQLNDGDVIDIVVPMQGG